MTQLALVGDLAWVVNASLSFDIVALTLNPRTLRRYCRNFKLGDNGDGYLAHLR